jgi:uncharacterized membrane protein YdjX (TVP38/TMEM64 family)
VAITLLAVLSGVLNGLAWGVVVVYLFFTVGAAYVMLEGRGAGTPVAQA